MANTIAATDFFSHQDAARRKTSLLVVYYVLAVALIILGVYLAFAGMLVLGKSKSGKDVSAADLWNSKLFLGVTSVTALIVVAGSAYKIKQVSQGGEAVATMLGAKPIEPNSKDPDERKILNVVEEMAIASGAPVPRVFVMENEEGINAFAAGLSPSNAVVGVTRGCIHQLTRDELQGVIAHEFSHILNGDMRLNIKLMGVLHGILVIGLVGFWVFRSSLYSSGRSRSNRKDNNMPIVVLGLLVMIIGYVGVFFGKLIKSAVSRQREFLADASSVQFTRNPGGIAGALKKIGGFSKHSRLATKEAEEASHMFFANGLGSMFLNAMATHPPLEERIRRIDPHFDGEFEKSQAAPTRASQQPRAVVAGLAGMTAGFAIEPDEVVARVGAPSPQHMAYAAGLVAALPEAASESAREPFGARAVIYCLLLNKETEPRNAQLARLTKHADPAVLSETRRIMKAVESTVPEGRLPLADIALSTLKILSRNQYTAFRENVEYLVGADKSIDLFEYALQRMIGRRLAPLFEKTRPPSVIYHNLKPVLPKCAELISCLAYWGADDMPAAEAAFAKAMSRLEPGKSFTLMPNEQCGLKAFDQALDELVRASAGIKKKVVTACATCIGADGRVTVDEAELLRAVADSLDCPIPPFLA
jgi:Zn-dependent protease with chaperone function